MLAASNKINKYPRRAGYTYIIFYTLDKSMASLSTCNLDVMPWTTILFNLAKFVWHSSILAIDKYCTIHLNVDVRVCVRVRACVRACVRVCVCIVYE